MEPLTYLGMMGEDGKFHPNSPTSFKAGAKAFAGRPVKVTFEEPRETRSDRQNRAFYGLAVRAFCEHMGYRFNLEADKEYVKREMLIAVGHFTMRRGLDGTEKPEPKPTRKMDTKDFSDLFQAIQELGAEMGIVIPDPDPELVTV